LAQGSLYRSEKLYPIRIPMRVLAALALSFGLLSGAHAGQTTYRLLDVCRFDMDQYCKDIPPRKVKQVKECLAKHEKDLLPRCQDHYKEAN
jgi:hypothetical protein